MAADDTLDDDAIQDYSVRLREIGEVIRQAGASDSPDRLEVIEELEATRQWLTAELRKSKGWKGQQRKLGSDDKNRVRNRVGNAVRRALKRVAVYDPPLYASLKADLKLGHHLRYAPQGGVAWNTGS